MIHFIGLIKVDKSFVFSIFSYSLAHQFSLSLKLQKLTSDLAGMEQQKKVLEMELEKWRQITFLQQTAPAPPPAPTNAECSCKGKTIPAQANPASQALEAEVKQLQAKLKVCGWLSRRTLALMTCPYALSYGTRLIR